MDKFPDDAQFGTDPLLLARTDGPDTSRDAAETVKSSEYEKLALEIIAGYELKGCILDELRDGFEERAPPHTQFTNRRTGLHQKGLVLDTGSRRVGAANRKQAVYVATHLLPPEWLEYIRNCPTARNPCLWPDTVKAAQVDDTTLLYYVLRHGMTAASRDLNVRLTYCRAVRDKYLATYKGAVHLKHGETFWQQINLEAE